MPEIKAKIQKGKLRCFKITKKVLKKLSIEKYSPKLYF